MGVVVVVACGGRTSNGVGSSDGGASSAESGGVDSQGVCTPPPMHRPAAAACPSHADAGAAACTSSTDCDVDAGFRPADPYCFQGRCGVDLCVSDADCTNGQICACAGPVGGEPYGVPGNYCVTGDCKVDSDCGPCGFCSPSSDACDTFGGTTGFGCHRPGDPCAADGDCGPQTPGSFTNPYCAYDPEMGHWSCAVHNESCGG